MRQPPPVRSLWASGTIGAAPRGNLLHLYVTTPAEMVDVLRLIDPFQPSALLSPSVRVGMRVPAHA